MLWSQHTVFVNLKAFFMSSLAGAVFFCFSFWFKSQYDNETTMQNLQPMTYGIYFFHFVFNLSMTIKPQCKTYNLWRMELSHPAIKRNKWDFPETHRCTSDDDANSDFQLYGVLPGLSLNLSVLSYSLFRFRMCNGFFLFECVFVSSLMDFTRDLGSINLCGTMGPTTLSIVVWVKTWD